MSSERRLSQLGYNKNDIPSLKTTPECLFIVSPNIGDISIDIVVIIWLGFFVCVFAMRECKYGCVN